jgi:predicted acylesterase/phospholipase RssA
MNALQTRLAGRPAFFHPHVSLRSRLPHRIGLYDTDPMRRTLETLIDFDMLNAGRARLSVLAVDLRTGKEVAFDTTRTRGKRSNRPGVAGSRSGGPRLLPGGPLLGRCIIGQ